jgi:hypothetical protein
MTLLHRPADSAKFSAPILHRLLVLPNIRAAARGDAAMGVCARGGDRGLERLPRGSTALADSQRGYAEVRAIAARMFRAPSATQENRGFRFGKGWTYLMKNVIDRADVLDWHSTLFDPFVNALRRHVAPDFGIDFVREAIRENRGLVFAHRTAPEAEIYFVANVRDRPVDSRVSFRVGGLAPQECNPYSGESKPLYEYEGRGASTLVPVRLAPFESTIFVFAAATRPPHVVRSDFEESE